MGGDTNNPQHPHSSGVSPPDPGSGMLHAPHFAAKNKVSFSRRGPMLAGSSLPQMGNGVGEARGVGGGDQPTPPPPNHTPSPSLPDPSTYPAPARPPLPAFWWRWRRWWRRRWRCAAPSAAEGPGSAPAEMGADSPPAPGRSYAAPGPAVPGSELPPTAALGARCPASLGGSLRSLRGGSWKCWGGGRLEPALPFFPHCSYLLHRAAGLLHRPQSAFLQLLLAAGPRPFLPAADLTSVIQAFVILVSVEPRTRPPGNPGEGREMGTRPPTPISSSPPSPPNSVTEVPLVANVAPRRTVPEVL